MFVLGHLGFGNKIASPWSKTLPRFPLFLGMLLPDLVDKPLYYGLRLLTDNYGISEPLISSTRTLGHTGIFLFLVLLSAGLLRSRWLSALGLGMTTHLLLDCTLDHYIGTEPSSAVMALCWPFLVPHFYIRAYKSLGEHLAHLNTSPIIFCEITGGALLFWDYLRSPHWRKLKARRRQVPVTLSE
jgi:hypothetical protein